jgi:hypothetical protein
MFIFNGNPFLGGRSMDKDIKGRYEQAREIIQGEFTNRLVKNAVV